MAREEAVSIYLELLLVLLGYVVGSVPTGLWVVRAVKGVDIRRYGSGNIGTVNVYRTAGPVPAAAVLVADILKGAGPVVLAQSLGVGPLWAILAGAAAIAGHNWSVFLNFQGGKGVATTLGVLLGVSPVVGGLALLVWVLLVAVTRYSSVGSMAGAIAVPLLMWGRGEPREHIVFGVVAAAFVLYRHRSNLVRLLKGHELKINQRLPVSAGDEREVD